MATDFRPLQRNFLGALPLGFEGVKTLAMQKLKNKEITPLVDVPVQPLVQGESRWRTGVRGFHNCSPGWKKWSSGGVILKNTNLRIRLENHGSLEVQTLKKFYNSSMPITKLMISLWSTSMVTALPWSLNVVRFILTSNKGWTSPVPMKHIPQPVPDPENPTHFKSVNETPTITEKGNLECRWFSTTCKRKENEK